MTTLSAISGFVKSGFEREFEIGYGYVLNGMGTHLTDPRDRALRTAMYRSIGVTDPYLRAR
jgi:hypothetical protein